MHEITYRTHDFLSVLSDFESLDQSAVEANTWLGFDVAERVFGISPLLTVEEMSSVGEPDSLSMVMYLSQFYQLLKDMPPPAGERQEETLWPKKQPQITKQMTTQTLKKKKNGNHVLSLLVQRYQILHMTLTWCVSQDSPMSRTFSVQGSYAHLGLDAEELLDPL